MTIFEIVQWSVPFSIVNKLQQLFVEAGAKSKIRNLKSGKELEKDTRDLFILKNTGVDWKIYRYIFNSQNPA